VIFYGVCQVSDSFLLLSFLVFVLGTKGAPESILERCTHLRIDGTEKVPMTSSIKDQIMDVVQRYGTGDGQAYASVVVVTACNQSH